MPNMILLESKPSFIVVVQAFQIRLQQLKSVYFLLIRKVIEIAPSPVSLFVPLSVHVVEAFRNMFLEMF